MINSQRPGMPSVSSTGTRSTGQSHDHDQLAAAAFGCDAVIHLAAKVGRGVNIGDIDGYALRNDYGTAMALRVAAEVGISRFLYASSMVVYGKGRYSCAEHCVVRPPPRRRDDLEAGRFDPAVPDLQRSAESRTGTGVGSARSAQRLCGDEGTRRTAGGHLEP
jgi:dTDP-L-rhamnose 4-epimerase